MRNDVHRASILLVHDDSELLDLLTTFFEAKDFEVSIAATGFHAHRLLQGEREFEVIVAGWLVGGRVGAEMYEWALANKYHLRGQFIFLAEEPPDDFEEVVEGRCLCLQPDDYEEIVRVAESAAERYHQLRQSNISEAELQWVDSDTPTLLLVDDEPILLMMMRRLLRDVGFDVIAAESGNHAIALLQSRGTDVDVVLSDWYMSDGGGADLFAWIQRNYPSLQDRCVFMSAGAPEDFKKLAPECALIPKGQDSPTLINTLLQTAKQPRVNREPVPGQNDDAAEFSFDDTEHEFDDSTGEFALD